MIMRETDMSDDYDLHGLDDPSRQALQIYKENQEKISADFHAVAGRHANRIFVLGILAGVPIGVFLTVVIPRVVRLCHGAP